MTEPHIYFPEPETRDDSFGRCKETTPDWLRRSTNPRAVALREYMNESLNHFPPTVATSLAKRLQHDWRAHVFEMQVGRYLQVLGARVEHQPEGSNGTRIDFFATFPDGVVSIECVTKSYNEGPRLLRE